MIGLGLGLGDSLIPKAGLGLFAKKIYRKGEIVCEYAGNHCEKSIMMELYLENIEEYLRIHQYARDLDEDTVIIGDPELGKADLGKSGVYVNDGACLQPGKHDRDAIQRYVRLSMKACNVEPLVQGDKLFYVASKRIKKGEEIYAHYGPHYWLLLGGVPADQLRKF